MLSRYPIRNAFALPFENQARLRWRLDPFQPRRGGRMALRAESGGVLVYNAHIESAKDDRFRHKQVDEMLFDHLEPERADLPVVFAGDFNTGSAPDKSPIVRCLTDEGFVDALGALDDTAAHLGQPCAPARLDLHQEHGAAAWTSRRGPEGVRPFSARSRGLGRFALAARRCRSDERNSSVSASCRARASWKGSRARPTPAQMSARTRRISARLKPMACGESERVGQKRAPAF